MFLIQLPIDLSSMSPDCGSFALIQDFILNAGKIYDENGKEEEEHALREQDRQKKTSSFKHDSWPHHVLQLSYHIFLDRPRPVHQFPWEAVLSLCLRRMDCTTSPLKNKSSRTVTDAADPRLTFSFWRKKTVFSDSPIVSSLWVIKRVRHPSLAEAAAASTPACPPPTTMTSKDRQFDWRRTCVLIALFLTPDLTLQRECVHQKDFMMSSRGL